MRISDWSSDVCSSDLLQSQNVALDDVDRQQFLKHRVLPVEVFAAALDHCRGVINGDDLAVVGSHVTTQGLGHRAQRAAQVIQMSMRLCKLSGDRKSVG